MAVPLMFQPLAKYAQFEGRSRRSEFWLWMLFRFLLSIAMVALIIALIAPAFSAMIADPHTAQARAPLLMADIFRIYPLFMLIDLGLFLPTLTVAVRRLHDSNRSGLWLLTPLGVSAVGLIVLMGAGVTVAVVLTSAGPHSTAGQGLGAIWPIFAAYAFFFITLLSTYVVLLIFMITGGTRGPNRFGPDPKGMANAAA